MGCRKCRQHSHRPGCLCAARQTRLSTSITTLPRRLDLYFTNSPLRKAVWAAIAFSAGFYAANTVSLSFGALAINDVVAAAVSVGFCEVVSYAYYSASRVTLKLVFLNAFKMGVTLAFMADAFKLGAQNVYAVLTRLSNCWQLTSCLALLTSCLFGTTVCFTYCSRY